MANIHLSTSGNGGNLIINGNRDHQNVHVGDATMPKYVGARAIVERVEDGVRITLTDYKGTTQETIAEAISNITTNADGSLTFTLANGDTLTTGSLKGPQGDQGPQGIQGEKGDTGETGPQGAQGVQGEKGDTGEQGPKGDQGPKGEQGPSGEDGEDGHTPVITATKSGKVTTIYVDGTPIATINDGDGGGVTSVNGQTGDVMITVPTKVSDLQNDSGFITSYTETDPTVPSWAKASTKPPYTASEVGAVPTSRKVNGKALTSDITLSASDVSALPASTSIPSKTSDLTNDSGFITLSDLPIYNGGVS